VGGIAAPTTAETSKNDDWKPKPWIEVQPQIKKPYDDVE